MKAQVITHRLHIAAQLKKQGIIVYSVTQPTDASTASGTLQQNIQSIFSEYDNQLRRKKCRDECRTPRVNEVFRQMADLVRV